MVKLFTVVKMLSPRKIKSLKSLALKKHRREQGEFIIEGKRLVAEAHTAGQPIQQIYVTTAFQATAEEKQFLTALETCAPITVLTEKEMERISQTRTPAGILAVCPLPSFSEPAAELKRENWLYLDSVSDPGNLGTLLRTATWFGVRAVALGPDGSDPFNPKVVRSGMGAHFHLQFLAQRDLLAFNHSYTVLGADHRGQALATLETIPKPWVLVVGNEAHGLSTATRSLVHRTIAIPRVGRGESLNVGVAAGIILHYLTA